ncbi:hypothetical protein CRI93_04725 [Longimonas halophila]|uniref:SWIM-type domain-containing protein n=1 Tax=Longimonas halophila TaxID=1469170 RepID=A0A2H3P2M9_9BACT|nr:SWIM zinc finger family protein [Longimonas halophila]PEN08422.1 hypothetical protein CRI93_04725 [Longimonas halophila]
MNWYQHYERTEPRTVKGGIKAKSKRGAFGTTWWGERWEETLHGFGIDSRLQRAKRYARKGQVLAIEVEAGQVTSEVQGSRSDPYEVTIRLRPYDETEWGEIVEAFRRQPYFAAALLAGDMPSGVEAIVERAGLTLFPEREADLKTNCSCPDWSNPCKHIAAVYLLLAEEFDRDPFLLFRLRGMRQGALMDRIGSSDTSTDPEAASPNDSTPAPAPLQTDGFWDAPDLPSTMYGSVETPSTHAALPKQLGKFPFWRSDVDLLNTLEPVYEAASEAGMKAFEAEAAPAESP